MDPQLRRGEYRDLPFAPGGRGPRAKFAGKRTAEVIQQEVAQEVGRLLRVVFAERRNSGALGFKAVEQATRHALHQAGASLIEMLLNDDLAYEPQQHRARGGRARDAGKHAKKLVTSYISSLLPFLRLWILIEL